MLKLSCEEFPVLNSQKNKKLEKEMKSQQLELLKGKEASGVLQQPAVKRLCKGPLSLRAAAKSAEVRTRGLRLCSLDLSHQGRDGVGYSCLCH